MCTIFIVVIVFLPCMIKLTYSIEPMTCHLNKWLACIFWSNILKITSTGKAVGDFRFSKVALIKKWPNLSISSPACTVHINTWQNLPWHMFGWLQRRFCPCECRSMMDVDGFFYKKNIFQIGFNLNVVILLLSLHTSGL